MNDELTSTALNVRRLSQADCDRWNSANPIGTRVIVTKDDGSEVAGATRTEAWMANGQIAVVMVHGISGYYALCRVRRVQP